MVGQQINRPCKHCGGLLRSVSLIGNQLLAKWFSKTAPVIVCLNCDRADTWD